MIVIMSVRQSAPKENTLSLLAKAYMITACLHYINIYFPYIGCVDMIVIGYWTGK